MKSIIHIHAISLYSLVSETIASIKTRLWNQFDLRESLQIIPEEFMLRYKTPVGGWVELFDEQQILYGIVIVYD